MSKKSEKMKLIGLFKICFLSLCFSITTLCVLGQDSSDIKMLRTIFDTELTQGKCYENLSDLCCNIGGRLSGSKEAEQAVEWAYELLKSTT